MCCHEVALSRVDMSGNNGQLCIYPQPRISLLESIRSFPEDEVAFIELLSQLMQAPAGTEVHRALDLGIGYMYLSVSKGLSNDETHVMRTAKKEAKSILLRTSAHDHEVGQ